MSEPEFNSFSRYSMFHLDPEDETFDLEKLKNYQKSKIKYLFIAGNGTNNEYYFEVLKRCYPYLDIIMLETLNYNINGFYNFENIIDVIKQNEQYYPMLLINKKDELFSILTKNKINFKWIKLSHIDSEHKMEIKDVIIKTI